MYGRYKTSEPLQGAATALHVSTVGIPGIHLDNAIIPGRSPTYAWSGAHPVVHPGCYTR